MALNSLFNIWVDDDKTVCTVIVAILESFEINENVFLDADLLILCKAEINNKQFYPWERHYCFYNKEWKLT